MAVTKESKLRTAERYSKIIIGSIIMNIKHVKMSMVQIAMLPTSEGNRKILKDLNLVFDEHKNALEDLKQAGF